MRLGFGGHYTFPAQAAPRRAAAAEAAGWVSLWWPDSQMGYHPPPPGVPGSPHETYDWAPLAGAAAAFTSRVLLGVAVTDPFRRHPALLAQTAQTLQDLSSGRFVLGLGLGAGNNLAPIGLAGSADVGVLEEAVDIMRLLWSTTGPVTFHGRTWQLDRAVLGLDSAHHGPPAVWIGGAGPRSLSLTGRKGDGWLPVMMPPGVYAARLATLREHARKTGRDPGSVVAGCLFLTVAADTERDCRRLLDTPWVRALALFQPARFFTEYGYTHPLGDRAAGVRDYIATHGSVSDYLKLVEGIPLDLVERLVLWGDAQRLAAELRGYAAAGVEHAVIFNVSGMGTPPPGTVRTSYEVLAAVREGLLEG